MILIQLHGVVHEVSGKWFSQQSFIYCCPCPKFRGFGFCATSLIFHLLPIHLEVDLIITTKS